MEIKFPPGINPLDHEIVNSVVRFAAGRDVHLFMVGGCLRDLLLRSYSFTADSAQSAIMAKDFDFALEGASAFDFARDYAGHHDGHFVPLDAATDTARVVVSDGTILDFAGCMDKNIAEDVFRRDFSINALYWDPSKPAAIIDLVGGAADLKDRRVRALGEAAFLDDPLRMVRAFRFSATLDFSVTAETEAWIKRHHRLITAVAPERTTAELIAVFAAPRCWASLQQLSSCGVLEVIFPELLATRAVPGNSHHHLGLYDHSLETVDQIEEVLRVGMIGAASPASRFSAIALEEELCFGVSRLAATKLACLLHDIGKPATWLITDEGKHTFIGHDGLGGQMVSLMAERLRWPRQLERHVSKLVGLHLRPGQLFHQKETNPPSEKAFARFYRKVGNDVPELILLALADLGATQGPAMLDETPKLRKSLIELLERFYVFNEESRLKQRFLSGTDLMKLLGIQAGPQVGRILAMLDEAQDCNEITDRLQAEILARRIAESSSDH
jgi:putative nucleotidyltransferase with HDIG domain